MTQASTMIGLLAETPIHAGTGQELGVVDLPVQREAHTDYPCVFASSLKGSIRSKAENKRLDWIDTAFGPDRNNSSEHAGAVLVSDARLALLPVRSLTTHYRLATCPAILKRLQADRRRLGLAALTDLPRVGSDNEALVDKENGGAGNDLFLEEFRFTPRAENLGAVLEQLGALVEGDDERERLARQLVIVHDDMFAMLARHATPVNAHVAIDSESKTVKRRALWYEESVPPDTLFYACLVVQPPRKKHGDLDATSLRDHLCDALFGAADPYLQVGGNETVGMGWCRVQAVWQKEG